MKAHTPKISKSQWDMQHQTTMLYCTGIMGAVRVAEAQGMQRVLRSVGRWEDKTT